MRLRACLETTRGAVFGEKAGWRGATKENIPGGSSTEEQRSQTAFSPKTLRAAGLLSVAGVDSFLTARCGDARNSPPWPQPKSLAAAPLVVSKQALSDLQVRFDLFRAVRADAMAEADVGVNGYVAFHAVPVVLIVANFLAIAADGQQTVQLVHAKEGILQLGNPGGQRRLQLYHPAADLHAGAEFLRVERLGDIIIRAGFKA